MNNKTGKQFEDLSAFVIALFADTDAKVEKNVLVQSEFGQRQFDIVLRKQVKPFGEMKVGIEARDHSRKSDVTKIDAFESKLADCAGYIDKGVMINRRGYSKTAVQKARRKGIQLYRLEDRSDQIIEEAFRIPIVISETRVGLIHVSGYFHVEKATLITQESIKINGLRYTDFCLKCAYECHLDISQVKQVDIPINTLEIGGKEFRTKDSSVRIYLIKRNHFGYVNELPNTVVLKDELGQDSKILIDSKAIFESLSFRDWPNFWQISDAPKHLKKIDCGSVDASFEGKAFDQVMRPFRNQ